MSVTPQQLRLYAEGIAAALRTARMLQDLAKSNGVTDAQLDAEMAKLDATHSTLMSKLDELEAAPDETPPGV